LTQQVDFTISADGWSQGATHEFSPNFDFRPASGPVDVLVIHNISLPPRQFGGPYITDLFLNRLDCDAHPYFDQLRTLHVSAHFLIRRDGHVVQFVSTENRAWHAGVSEFDGRMRCNDFTIGIEMEGSDFDPFEDAQYTALVQLTQAVRQRYALKHIVGHEDIAPVRKTDPGPYFEWERYQRSLAEMYTDVQFPFLKA
jgi:AmpD protein